MHTMRAVQIDQNQSMLDLIHFLVGIERAVKKELVKLQLLFVQKLDREAL